VSDHIIMPAVTKTVPGAIPSFWLFRTGAGRRVHTKLTDLAQLAKPRITVMVVLATYVGFQMGVSPLGASPSLTVLLAVLVGTALSCMGASALNQVYERHTDSLMHRTQDRPLPAGRVGVPWALGWGLAWSVGGVSLLGFVAAAPLAAGLSALTIFSYTLIYTPLKQVHSLSTVVGAIPGALPPVIGYTAATGALGIEAWLMFSILFLWQLPHFLAIAWLYRDDYARAGIPVLPAIDPQCHSTCRQVLISCMALVPLGLVPSMLGITGVLYFFGVLLAGLGFLGFAIALIIGRTRWHARALFFASLVYLPMVFVLMLIDRI